MAAERVDYSSDEEYQQALQQEEYYQALQQEDKYYQSQQEPNVVPCQGCGCQMHQENQEPKYNFCQKCKDIINGTKQANDNTESEDDLPF